MSKSIFIDVDGTLVSGQSNISDKNKQAIIQARKNGHFVYLCTGRAKCSIQSLLIQLDFDGFICSSGGYIEHNNTCIFSHYVEDDLIKKARDVLEYYGVDYALEATNYSYMTKNLAKSFLGDTSKWSKDQIEIVMKEIYQTYSGKDIELYAGDPVHKMCYHCDDATSVLKIKEKLKKDFLFIDHTPNDGEIMVEKMNKAIAVQKILEISNASLEDSVAIGDSMNDYELLEYVAFPIAVGNAKQALKDIAKLTVNDVTNDAIVDAFEKLQII